MKRLISVIVFILIGTVLAEGEEMKFVTVLSSPVGTFAQLETANPTRAVQSPVVNFGTSRVTVGRMELKGAAGYIEDLYLQSGTELGGNAGAYRLEQGMEVGTGGRITGGRLMANEVDFSGALEGKSEVKGSLYIDEIAVAGAKADSLTIPEEVELTASSGEEEVLEWSNEYNCDYERLNSGDEGITVSDWMDVGDCSTYRDSCDGDLTTEFDVDSLKGRKDSFSCTDIKITGVCSAWNTGPWQDRYYEFDSTCAGKTAGTQACEMIPYFGIMDTLVPLWAKGVENYWNQYIKDGDSKIVKYVYKASGSNLELKCTGSCYQGCYSSYYSGSTRVCTHLTRFWFPSIEGYCPAKCRKIQYLADTPCKTGSPTYDSYLLKSKTKTDSSSSEEATAGTCKHLRDIGYYD